MSQTVSSGDTLTIASGDTITVNRVLTVEGEVEVEGRLVVDNARNLQASGTDTDTSSATLERIRNLVGGAENLTVTQGNTQTIDSATSVNGATVGGRLIVEDTLTVTEGLPAKDSDTATGTLEAGIFVNLTASGTDTDTASATLDRTRDLQATATDTDTATATLDRLRNLTAEAFDSDDATARLLFSSSETDPRQFTIDVLDSIGDWPDGEAEIYRNEDVPHKSKENNADPAIYVHIPTSGDLERFSADPVDLIETDSVRMNIWIAPQANQDGAALARQYRDKVVEIFQRYMNDNFEFTEFHDVQPTESTDFRHQKIARQTDHYIYQVEIETERIDNDR